MPVFLNKLIFVRKLRDDDGATVFFIAKKHQKTISNFLLDSLIAIE